MRRYGEVLGIAMSQMRRSLLVKAADSDGDGLISFDEYCDILRCAPEQGRGVCLVQ